VLWRCWLGGRKCIRPVKTEWWVAGVVICLERGADLHMAQLMPLPLAVSCKGPLNGCLFCLFVVLTLMSLLGLYHKILEVGGGGAGPQIFWPRTARACMSKSIRLWVLETRWSFAGHRSVCLLVGTCSAVLWRQLGEQCFEVASSDTVFFLAWNIDTPSLELIRRHAVRSVCYYYIY